MKARRPLLTLLSLIAGSGCGGPTTPPSDGVRWVAPSDYFEPDCWGGHELANTPVSVPVRLAVERRETVSYVSFLSQNCEANLYDQEFDELPITLRLEDTAILFRVDRWSEIGKRELAEQLNTGAVLLPSTHGPTFTDSLEVYDAELDILGAEFEREGLVSNFAIGKVSDLRRRNDLDPIADY